MDSRSHRLITSDGTQNFLPKGSPQIVVWGSPSLLPTIYKSYHPWSAHYNSPSRIHGDFHSRKSPLMGLSAPAFWPSKSFHLCAAMGGQLNDIQTQDFNVLADI